MACSSSSKAWQFHRHWGLFQMCNDEFGGPGRCRHGSVDAAKHPGLSGPSAHVLLAIRTEHPSWTDAGLFWEFILRILNIHPKFINNSSKLIKNSSKFIQVHHRLDNNHTSSHVDLRGLGRHFAPGLGQGWWISRNRNSRWLKSPPTTRLF